MAGRGGYIPGSGRKKGVPNKCTAELKLVAQEYGPAAIAKLALMAGLKKGRGRRQKDYSEQVQLGALKELLDRGYGKPVQPLAQDAENPFKLLMESLDGLTCGLPSEYERARGPFVIDHADEQTGRAAARLPPMGERFSW